MTSLISRKLAGLIDVIDDLRRQLRAAVASELSQAIAATVREVLEVLIARRELPRWDRPFGDDRRAGNDFDEWDEQGYPGRDREWHGGHDGECDTGMTEQAASPPPPLLSAPAISLAVNAGFWLFRLSRSWLCGLGGLVAVGLAAGYGGPVTRSVLTVAAAVQQ
ncbi:hypothetical protein, partial [Zavarzinella formosa]|uniref:hypothetical protein n=1 Tax=Zavarzinella formosa TaxID=360055 RepID=UPI0004967CC0